MKNILNKVIVFILDMLAFCVELLGWFPTKRGDRFLREGGGESDLIGVIVPVCQDVTKIKGKVRYSGIEWNARLVEASSLETISSGTKVEIVAVDGNVLIISCKV